MLELLTRLKNKLWSFFKRDPIADEFTFLGKEDHGGRVITLCVKNGKGVIKKTISQVT